MKSRSIQLPKCPICWLPVSGDECPRHDLHRQVRAREENEVAKIAADGLSQKDRDELAEYGWG